MLTSKYGQKAYSTLKYADVNTTRNSESLKMILK